MPRQSSLLLLALGTCQAGTNVCFTAHEKAALSCKTDLLPGPLFVHTDLPKQRLSLVAVRRRSWPLRTRLVLCESAHCSRCFSVGGAWVPCAAAAEWPVQLMSANGDLPRAGAIAFGLGLICVPVVLLLVAVKMRRGSTDVAASPGSATDGSASKADAEKDAPKGFALRVALAMLQFAARPWFPWVAAFGTGLNLFTLVFTAATVVLYLAAVLARPRRWATTAVANAIGATVGSAILLGLLRSQGVEVLHEQFPTVFHSAAWKRMMEVMQGHGIGGMVAVAALPLILHPIIAFGVLTGMSDAAILGVVLLGRTIKYLIMAYITTTAPAALKYFGISPSLFNIASSVAEQEDAKKL